MANNRPEVVVYNDTKIVDIIFIAQGISPAEPFLFLITVQSIVISECHSGLQTRELGQAQRVRKQRVLLQHQNFDFLFYLGLSGCFTQSKHIIMKVVQT